MTAAGHVGARLITPRVGWFLAGIFFGMVSFYLLLAVLPLEASSAGPTAAGIVTGLSMAACVATEVFVSARLGHLDHAPTLALGTALLTLPNLLLLAGPELVPLLVTSLIRGAGLAVVVVAGTAVAADAAPVGRRGEALGVYGIAVSLPGTFSLPLGVWLTDRIGFTAVALLALAVGILATGLVLLAPPRRTPSSSAVGSPIKALRFADARRPALIFCTATFAAGIYLTFLAVAMAHTSAAVISVALFLEMAGATISRWAAGRAGDRMGPRRLLLPAVLVALLGGLLLIAFSMPAAVLAGMTLFGCGFGALQNVTLSLMYEAVSENHFAGISALWNAAFDTGSGAGPLAFGVISEIAGYPVAFAGTAAVLGVGVLLSLRAPRRHA